MFEEFFITLDPTEVTFSFILAGTILMMLYAITLIYNKLRLIENEIQAMRKDQTVMSEELEVVVNMKSGENN